MMVLTYIAESFWDARVWLPPNVTWSDLKPNENIKYANHNHLYYPLPMALALLVIRMLLEK